MRHVSGLVILVAVLSSGCAVPMGNGRTLYTFGEPPSALVSNNTLIEGDLYYNGSFVATLGAGETRQVRLPYNSYNVILTFKAVERQNNGEWVYRGQVSRSFVRSTGGAQHVREWVIRSVARPH